MRILYVIPYAPTPIRVRPYNLVQGLARRGHDVTLATVWSDQAEKRSLRGLQRQSIAVLAAHHPSWRAAINCLGAIPSRTPLQAVYSWNPNLGSQIEKLISAPENGKIDVVHVEHLRGAKYGQFIRSRLEALGAEAPIVWDSVDCISHLFGQTARHSVGLASRWVARFEHARTERLEGELTRVFDRTLVTSAADRAAMLRIAKVPSLTKERVEVVTNGVDLEYFTPEEDSRREPHTIVLSGKMSYHANVAMVESFVNEVMPLLENREPAVKLWIVGKAPPRRVRKLAHNPGITVTGEVPDIRPYLRRAAVAVAPLTYGAGVQNKVLEAMACATPIVASPVAAQGLQADPQVELPVAETPEEFAECLARLFADKNARRELGLAGRAYVERNHRWSKITDQLEAIYCGLNTH